MNTTVLILMDRTVRKLESVSIIRVMTHTFPLARRFKVVKERKEKNMKRILSMVDNILATQ